MDALYVLPVGETLGNAWDKVKGSKKSFWAAFIILFIIAFGIGILQGIAKGMSPGLGFIVGIVGQIIIFLMQIGLLYIGIQRAFDLPITYTQLFRAFDGAIALRAIGLYILQVIIFIPPFIAIFIGVFLGAATRGSTLGSIISVLLCLIGTIGLIYLSIRMMMGMALILDKGLNPWKAVKASFHITRSNFWSLLGILFLQFLIVFISLIPMGIGSIWTMPFMFILYGVMYKKLLVNLP